MCVWDVMLRSVIQTFCRRQATSKQVRRQEVQVVVKHPLQIRMHSPRFCKIPMTKHADQPTTNSATFYRIHVLPLLNAVFGNNSFSKMYVLHTQNNLCDVMDRILYWKVFILWYQQRHCLCLWVHNHYIYCMYNRTLPTYIQYVMYMLPALIVAAPAVNGLVTGLLQNVGIYLP
jgi:hypothetical protein